MSQRERVVNSQDLSASSDKTKEGFAQLEGTLNRDVAGENRSSNMDKYRNNEMFQY